MVRAIVVGPSLPSAPSPTPNMPHKVGDEDGDPQAEHGDDAREVAERQAVDDARGRGLDLAVCNLLHGLVTVGV